MMTSPERTSLWRKLDEIQSMNLKSAKYLAIAIGILGLAHLIHVFLGSH